MNLRHLITFVAARPARFLKEEHGTTLVEMAIILPVFLLVFIGLVEFGRMGAEYVMADKALQLAARTAATRPAACPGVPNLNLRGTVPPGSAPPRFGTMCSAGASICANPGTITCTGNINNSTVAEIWNATSVLMPTHATPANLRFSYAFDANLGFLGGPYVPVVTVEIQNLNFIFTTPLTGLAALTGGGPVPGATLPFPAMSTSLPAEDLAMGENG
ncbi:MAG: pilus assembly protein [Rhodobacteraceae bacterium]|nr:pilus assembly protein [Paracoccaceae bacterium]